MSELKPCPFCGGEAELQDDISREDRMFYRAVCSDIECQGHYCNDWSMMQGMAIDRWNTRAELPVAYASISPSIEMLKEHGVVVEHTCHNADQSKARAGTFSVGGRFECSHCGASYGYTELPYPFCPWCGAKVVES